MIWIVETIFRHAPSDRWNQSNRDFKTLEDAERYFEDFLHNAHNIFPGEYQIKMFERTELRHASRKS